MYVQVTLVQRTLLRLELELVCVQELVQAFLLELEQVLLRLDSYG